MAPEYAQTGQITEKADVYSFGVVLVELVTGRKAVDINRPKGQQCLSEWVYFRVQTDLIILCIDQMLSAESFGSFRMKLLRSTVLLKQIEKSEK